MRVRAAGRRPRATWRLALLVACAAFAAGCGGARPQLGARREETPAAPEATADDHTAASDVLDASPLTPDAVARAAIDPCVLLTDALRASAGVSALPDRDADGVCRAGIGEHRVEVHVHAVRGSVVAEAAAFQEEREGEQWPIAGVPGNALSHVEGGTVEVACFFRDLVVTFRLPAVVLTETTPNHEGPPAIGPATITALVDALAG